jgi:hypothetical protein
MLTVVKRNLTKFILDLLVFIGFLLALDPRATGIAIHEWLAIAVSAAIITHLLLNWNWIVGVTRQFFHKVTAKPRLNYILNWLFFIDFILIMLTGLMISQAVLPAFGIRIASDFAWRRLHSLTADASLFILALHLALNWDWVANIFKRYILHRIGNLHLKRKAIPVPTRVQS